jgi:hypothetical protein
MLALIEAFMKIALRRLGPEDLPDSPLLLALAAAAYVGLQAVAAVPVFGSFSAAVVRSVVADTVLLAGCAWLLLRALGFPARYRQTLTALFGTGALLTVFVLPAYLWARATGSAEGAGFLPSLAILVVLVWSVAANGHILARALSTGFPLGVALALCYLLLNFVLVSQLGQPA